MLKNHAGQQLTLFVFDASTGMPATGKANTLTFFLAKDDGGYAALATPAVTEEDAIRALGNYAAALSKSETDAVKLSATGKSTDPNLVVVPMIVYPMSATMGVTIEQTNQPRATVQVTETRVR